MGMRGCGDVESRVQLGLVSGHTVRLGLRAERSFRV